MNGAQDLGGLTTFGPVRSERDEPVFHAAWEKRALAITLACNGLGEWTGDRNRFERESLDAVFYLTHSYYEIWLAALEKNLARKGFVAADEIAAGRALHAAPPAKKKLMAAQVASVLAAGSPYDRPASAPALFKAGERVRMPAPPPPAALRARTRRLHRNGARRLRLSRFQRPRQGRGPALVLHRALRGD